MQTIRVTTWDHLKRLLVMVEEYYNMTDTYDCSFPILAGEVARQFNNTFNYTYFILYDTEKGVDAGYQNYSVDTTGVYHNLWVDVTYLKKQYRCKNLFKQHFLPLIYQLGEAANVKTVRFTTPMTPRVWERMTGRKVTAENVLVITNKNYKENEHV